MIVMDQGFYQCGRFICDNHVQLPRWEKTEATGRGGTVVRTGLDRLADELQLREQD